jgi:hypothetical protein
MSIRTNKGVTPGEDRNTNELVEDAVSVDAQARAPAAAPRSSSRGTRYLAVGLAVVVIGSAAGFWTLLGATVPNGDLEAAEAQLAQTEADLTATRDQAAQDRQSAAERATGLEEELAATVQTFEGEVSGLEGEITGLQENLDDTTSDLAVSQGEVADLSASLATESERAEGAEEQLTAAGGPLTRTLALTEFINAWNLWTGSDFVRLTDRNDADVSGYDEIISSLGIAETWEEWAKSQGIEPLRELDNLMERIDDPELQALFDDWFDCDRQRDCIRAYVVLDAAIMQTLAAEIRATGDAIGTQLVGINTF